MSLIDVSYFTKGSRHVLNAAANTASALSQGHNSLAVNERIESYIDYYQPFFLKDVVGASVQSLLEDYLEAKEADEDFETDSDYEQLISYLQEPFADYVFFHILADSNRKSTITGDVVLKSDNTIASPNVQQCAIWNDMVERLSSMCDYYESNGTFAIVIQKSMLSTINIFGL